MSLSAIHPEWPWRQGPRSQRTGVKRRWEKTGDAVDTYKRARASWSGSIRFLLRFSLLHPAVEQLDSFGRPGTIARHRTIL
jgi:hypothetical protein